MIRSLIVDDEPLVRERLGALYGERAAFSIDTAPNAGFRARIQIPRHEGRS